MPSNPNTCDPPIVNGCEVPETLYVVTSGYSGCGGIQGTAELKWAGGVWHGKYSVDYGGSTYTFSFVFEYTSDSDPEPWKLSMNSSDPDCLSTEDTATATCEPFLAQWYDFHPMGVGCGGCGLNGGFDAEVSESPTP